MDHFLYRDGILHAEDVPLPEIAAAVGTPVYVYSTATLTRHFRLFQEALAWGPHLICFSMKSNPNRAVVALMQQTAAVAVWSLADRLPCRWFRPARRFLRPARWAYSWNPRTPAAARPLPLAAVVGRVWSLPG